MIANTQQPPYYAVIFVSEKSDETQGYDETSERMTQLALKQEGYLGMESAREKLGITVSYWSDLESIKKWKNQIDHTLARELGREKWYSRYKTRICLVERDYGYEKAY